MIKAEKGTETITRNVVLFKRYVSMSHPKHGEQTEPGEMEYMDKVWGPVVWENPELPCPSRGTGAASDDTAHVAYSTPPSIRAAESEDLESFPETSQQSQASQNLRYQLRTNPATSSGLRDFIWE
ncbi:hypothetical protein NDU88_004625 [Pleurodeles waltl]|uniref:Uncharacterized protein n=1 Tax=Pleurodeles waltl TaxID=8319 RepID=A0AAV7QF39_PLEWA|nr:hypothetical protein NDU88_004625 [Pleurodeles waltl]